MSMPDQKRPRRTISWAPVVFLVFFLALVAVIANYWVAPMLRAVRDGSPADRQRAVIYGTLVLILLLSLLLIGLLASFRFSAWLFRADGAHTPTPYIDIWEEAGRRVLPPDADELEEPDDKQAPPPVP
jgi:hypothetical protein